MVILCDALTKFTGRDSNHRIRVRVVVRITVEDFHTDRAFFESVTLPRQGLLHDVTQHPRASLAGLEQWVGEHPLQLLSHWSLLKPFPAGVLATMAAT
jgi:hypothetical protein